MGDTGAEYLKRASNQGKAALPLGILRSLLRCAAAQELEGKCSLGWTRLCVSLCVGMSLRVLE